MEKKDWRKIAHGCFVILFSISTLLVKRSKQIEDGWSKARSEIKSSLIQSRSVQMIHSAKCAIRSEEVIQLHFHATAIGASKIQLEESIALAK